MRKFALLFICLLGLGLFVMASVMQSLFVIQRLAAVTNVAGSVSILPQGAKAFVGLGDRKRVLAGDVVRTGSDGWLTLKWVDNSKIRVGPGTTLKVLRCQFSPSRDADTYLFKMDVGQVWVRVLKALSKPSKFEIATPTATAAVRGTVFSVKVAPDGKTQVTVLEGEVRVRSGDSEILVPRSQAADAGSGGPKAMTAAQKSGWDRVQDLALPELSLNDTCPLNDAATMVTVAGKAEKGAQVSVNGQPVQSSADGVFSAQVPVPASGRIVAEAKDAKGFRAQVVKTVAR